MMTLDNMLQNNPPLRIKRIPASTFKMVQYTIIDLVIFTFYKKTKLLVMIYFLSFEHRKSDN